MEYLKDNVLSKNTEYQHETISMLVKRRPPCNFFLCHLKMLRSLYQEDEEDETRPMDEVVSEEVWSMVQQFLDQRHKLQRTKAAAERWRGIVNEANNYFTENTIQKKKKKAIEDNDSSIAAMQGKNNWQTPPPSKRRKLTSPMSAKNYDRENENHNTFGNFRLVTKMLERRACIAEQYIQKDGNPFADLYTAASDRCEILTSLIQSSQNLDNTQLEKHDTETFDANRSYAITLDAKKKLWDMLVKDLNHVINA